MSKIIGQDSGGYYTNEGYAPVAELNNVQLTQQYNAIYDELDRLAEYSDCDKLAYQFEETILELAEREAKQ